MPLSAAREGTGYFNRRGRRLFLRWWDPGRAKTLVVLIHGFGEHSGRHAPLARQLLDHGVSVACLDLWGHGRSAGRRGDVERFEDYLDDLDQALREGLAFPIPAERLVAFGHSFGGLLAIHWAFRLLGTLRALVLQSPFLGFGPAIAPWRRTLADTIPRSFGPLALPTGLDARWLSHDLEIVGNYRTDPLVHRWMSVRCYRAVRAAMGQAIQQAPQIAVPTLLLYGRDDRVVSVEDCRAFYDRLRCPKQILGYEGSYHELHHEAKRTEVLGDIHRWLAAHA